VIREYALDYGLYYAKPRGLFSKINRRSGIFKSGPLDSKWTAQIEPGRAGRRSGRKTVPTVIFAAAPSPESANSRFTASPRERRTPGWSREQGELTKVEYEGGADPKTMRCSRWRTVPSVVRAEPPQDGFGASLRDGMERRVRELVFIAQRRFKERNGRIWKESFDRWNSGKKSDAGVRRKKVPWQVEPRCQRQRERTRHEAGGSARELGYRARPKAGKRPRGDGPRVEKQAATRGGGLRASDGPPGFTGWKPGRMKSFFSFFSSIISKHFQMILNPILNLNQTTPTKNSNATACVHKYVSTLIFDFKLIKIIITLNLYAHQIAL
jgi:hypothetical protein